MNNLTNNRLRQAAIALRDCGVIRARGATVVAPYEVLRKLGLATATPARNGIDFRLTEHGRAALAAEGLA